MKVLTILCTLKHAKIAAEKCLRGFHRAKSGLVRDKTSNWVFGRGRLLSFWLLFCGFDRPFWLCVRLGPNGHLPLGTFGLRRWLADWVCISGFKHLGVGHPSLGGLDNARSLRRNLHFCCTCFVQQHLAHFEEWRYADTSSTGPTSSEICPQANITVSLSHRAALWLCNSHIRGELLLIKRKMPRVISPDDSHITLQVLWSVYMLDHQYDLEIKNSKRERLKRLNKAHVTEVEF